MLKTKEFAELVEVFLDSNASKDAVKEAGVKIMLKMYKGRTDDTIATLRLAMWNTNDDGHQ